MDKLIPNITPAKETANYHHGNLREALLAASVDIIRNKGIQGLSLRNLAEVVGVSRTAPYHHFKDKDALLAAVAEQGFIEMNEFFAKVIQNPEIPLMQKLKQALTDYVRFAVQHPTQYELMFGRDMWQEENHDEFQRTAKDCFRQYVQLFELFKEEGLLSERENPLRLAQIMWATLHGLAKLASDGIFGKQDDLDDIIQYAMSRFEGTINRPD
jgi:AcrR family transcriptional regulator